MSPQNQSERGIFSDGGRAMVAFHSFPSGYAAMVINDSMIHTFTHSGILPYLFVGVFYITSIHDL